MTVSMAETLIVELEARGVALWVEGERVRFRAPKNAMGTNDRARLSSLRAEVTQRLRERAAATTSRHPMSYSQRALWFLHLQAPHSAAYHVAMSARLMGPLHEGALRHAAQALVDRHAVLRTTYGMEDGVPVQRVIGAAIPELSLHRADGADDITLRRTVLADYRRPFDLEHGPACRFSVYSAAPDDHVLLLTVHHIAADGWTLLMMIEEFAKLYGEAAIGAPANLERAPLQYSDYVTWQEQLLNSHEGERMWAFWQQQLAELPPSVPLLTDRGRPPVQRFRGESLEFELVEALSERLRSDARREGTTLFVLLMASFHALLHRLSGADDLIVGTPVFGRSRPQFMRVAGDFVNSVPVRTKLTPGMSFRDLVTQLRQTMLSVLDAQEFPLPLMVQRCVKEREPGRSPLFDTFFVLQRFDQFRQYEALLAGGEPDTAVDVGGMRMLPYVLHQQEGQFDVALQMVERKGRLCGVFKYNPDLFDATTIERMIGHYRRLLEGFVADPSARIDSLPMLGESEQRRMLLDWNATTADYPRGTTVHGLFEAQVDRTPDAVALRFETQTLDYRTLNARANQVAHRLRALGVRRESLVGVWMERSVDMVVALLAVLKAGGAYVPLDPAFPKDRIAYMMEDAGVPVVLTQSHLATTLGDGAPRALCLDDLSERLEAEPVDNPSPLSDAGNLAYVIYTSGSTGRPKGVMLEHRSVVNFLLSMHREPGIGAADRFVSVTTLSFDIAGLEIHGPLTCGATVVLASRATALDGGHLAALLESADATLLQATPATWRLLLDSGWRGRADLKMLCGGEGLPHDLADRLLASGGALWNMYGPTETTIWSTLWRVTNTERAISIGRPIANTQVYVLEPSGLPAPIGVGGELCIGGDGLARGYRNLDDLTAEKFVTIDFPRLGPRRVYRTGDVVRWLADGRLEFVGRRDHQVKVRGFRIELGEIESVLASHPAIRQALVVVREAAPGDARLVAYVAYTPGEDLTVSEVRRHLRCKLPDHMVPSLVVALGAIPLTPNGKVDRLALPDPFRGAALGSPGFVPPAPGPETTMAEIWRELLMVERVGAEDNFFELGGHSILSLRAAAAFEKQFGWRIDARTMFFQNLRQVVAVASRAKASGTT